MCLKVREGREEEKEEEQGKEDRGLNISAPKYEATLDKTFVGFPGIFHAHFYDPGGGLANSP